MNKKQSMANGGNKEIVSHRVELKQRIIVTAIEFFTKHGIKSITMDEIASSMGISKRTIYEIFKDKEELLVQCIVSQQEEMKIFANQVVAESENVLEVILRFYKMSIEIYHKTNKRFFDDISKYPRVNELSKRNREENFKSSVDFFKKGVEQGIFRSDVNFEVINLLVREQVDLLMNTNICSLYSFVEVYESIMFTYMRGISTTKGQQILEDFIKEYRQQKQK